MASQWYTYFVRCNDNSLYAGVTTDLKRRVHEHNSKILGAKYTRNKQPVCLVYFHEKDSRSDACKYEYQLKQLSKHKKESLVASFCQLTLKKALINT